jgi:hypothetical protein
MTGPQAPGPPPAFTPQQPVNPRPRPSRGCTTALAISGAFVVVLIIAGVVIAIVSSGSKTTPGAAGPGPTTVGPGGPSVMAGTGQGNPAPVGTAVTPAKGWTVRVTSAQLQGDATMKAENAFISPNSGKQFVIVGISVTNGGDQAATTASNVKLTLLSPGGVATDVSWARPPASFDVGSQLQPGATLNGNLAFEVARSDAAGSVLLAEPAFTMTKAEDQRFLALR